MIVGGTELFAPDQVSSEQVPGLGTLEVYPNGDDSSPSTEVLLRALIISARAERVAAFG